MSNNHLAQFQEIAPSLKSHLTLYMLEYLGVTVKLSSSHSAEELKVQIWTNTFTKFNSQGEWDYIDLSCNFQESNNLFLFQGGLRPTNPGDYQLTYRVGLKQQPEQWQWAGNFQENVYLEVKPPSPELSWTQGACYTEILPRVYVGNFIAASQASELGIDAVLNLTNEFTLTFSHNNHIVYKQIGLLDGAEHPIPEPVILEAITWIEEQLQQGKQKVLINCRAGIGRSGSIGLAYCFYKHPLWNYQQTLDYIWSKKADIYPHSGLQESLEYLFPIEKTDN